MSIAALLRGVEKRLRSAAVLNDQPSQSVGRICGVTLAPGRPAPGFGAIWYAVHWGGGRSDDRNPQSHNVAHAVTVTITARLAKIPRDRLGRETTVAGALLDLVDAVAAPDVIHGSYDVLGFANELIPGTAEYVAVNGGTASENGYLEPLVLLDFGPERECDGAWIGAGDATNVYAIPVRFGEGRRLQLYTG